MDIKATAELGFNKYLENEGIGVLYYSYNLTFFL